MDESLASARSRTPRPGPLLPSPPARPPPDRLTGGQCLWTGPHHGGHAPPPGQPRYLPGKFPGYKIFIGDLPGDTTVGMFGQWVMADPQVAAVSEDIIDISVSGGAASGLLKCILTCRSAASCREVYEAVWRWWAPVSPDIEPRGWHWLQVHYME